MTEPTVQVPVSLIRRLGTVQADLRRMGRVYDVIDEVMALLSQPTPTADHHDRHHDDDVAKPPRIEAMAPGTMFGDGKHRYTVEPIMLREVRRDDGQKFYADEIDPSTIRDMTPPAGT